MKSEIMKYLFTLIICVMIFVAMPVQEFIPPIEDWKGAQVLIAPVIVFYAAVALPLPLMLLVVFAGGLMRDLLLVQVMNEGVEFPLGWSILFYGGLGALLHGLRPMFLRGRWELHCLLIGVCVSLLLLLEYLMISFRRSGFVWNDEVYGPIIGSGVAAALLAPLVFLLFTGVARLIGYRFTPEKRVYDATFQT